MGTEKNSQHDSRQRDFSWAGRKYSMQSTEWIEGRPCCLAAALKLLLEALVHCAEIRRAVFLEQDGQSLAADLADAFVTRSVTSWTVEGFESFLSLLQL